MRHLVFEGVSTYNTIITWQQRSEKSKQTTTSAYVHQ